MSYSKPFYELLELSKNNVPYYDDSPWYDEHVPMYQNVAYCLVYAHDWHHRDVRVGRSVLTQQKQKEVQHIIDLTIKLTDREWKLVSIRVRNTIVESAAEARSIIGWVINLDTLRAFS